jgi:hypothetical protein
MRQTHVAGEKMFVDYAGATLEVIDGLTGHPGRLQLHLRRSDLDASAAQLDWLALPRLRLLRRRASLVHEREIASVDNIGSQDRR